MGPALPQFRTGRWSKALPTGLIEKYLTAHQDTDLVQLRDEIALADVLLTEALARLEDGAATSEAWTAATTALAEFKGAGRNVQSAQSALVKLEAALDAGASIAAARAEVAELLELRKKLVEAESKRLKDLHAMLSIERVMAIIAAVQEAVRKNVKDRDELAAVFTDLRGLLRPGGEATV